MTLCFGLITSCRELEQVGYQELTVFEKIELYSNLRLPQQNTFSSYELNSCGTVTLNLPMKIQGQIIIPSYHPKTPMFPQLECTICPCSHKCVELPSLAIILYFHINQRLDNCGVK